jgi:hypothetical protein
LVTAAANQGYAPLASPTFTGTPAAPTAAVGTSTTQLATTGFVGAGFLPLAGGTLTGAAGNRNLLTLRSGGTAPQGSQLNFSSVSGTAQATIYVGGAGNTLNFYDPGSNYGLSLDLTASQGHVLTGNLNVSGNLTTSSNLTAGGNYLHLINDNGVINGTGGPLIYGDTGYIALKWGSSNSGFLVQDYSGTNRLTLSPTGNLFVGGSCTANGYMTHPGIGSAFRTNQFNIDWTSSNAQLWIDTVNIGTITITSDYRIKDAVAELPSMWERAKALRPISYQLKDHADLFKSDPTERWGFIAHELQETLLESAATGYKDAPNIIQSPDPMTLFATLTKALQEAMARIEALEARLAPS